VFHEDKNTPVCCSIKAKPLFDNPKNPKATSLFGIHLRDAVPENKTGGFDLIQSMFTQLDLRHLIGKKKSR